jgi:GT2 family glycosyltransferase
LRPSIGGQCCARQRTLFEREARTDFELIIVDQTDEHDAETKAFLERLAARIVYRRFRFKSLPRARNEGLRIVKGKIVVFIDDDLLVQPGFLSGHLGPYEDERIWMVTGPAPHEGQRALSRHELSDDEYRRLFVGNRSVVQVDFDFAPCSWATGCNMPVRREAALRIGGFDENFIANAVGEDAEFCVRIRRAGGIIYHAGKAALVHLVAPSGGCRNVVDTDFI